MAFLWATIHVNNMEASLKFYQEVVGLNLRRKFSPAPGQDIAFLGIGETEVELYHIEGESHPEAITGISLGFTTSDATSKMSDLRSKGYEVSPMISPNPNLQFFYVKDPDGLNIQFVEDLRA